MARMQVDRPAGVILLADEVAWHMSSKRLRTAVERTMGWFTEFCTLFQKATTTEETDTDADSAKPSLFAVVVGGHLCGEEQIERQILAYLAGGATGMLFN